jgi:hypothetical protein
VGLCLRRPLHHPQSYHPTIIYTTPLYRKICKDIRSLSLSLCLSYSKFCPALIPRGALAHLAKACSFATDDNNSSGCTALHTSVLPRATVSADYIGYCPTCCRFSSLVAMAKITDLPPELHQ